jgi:hypothetical protein
LLPGGHFVKFGRIRRSFVLVSEQSRIKISICGLAQDPEAQQPVAETGVGFTQKGLGKSQCGIGVLVTHGIHDQFAQRLGAEIGVG